MRLGLTRRTLMPGRGFLPVFIVVVVVCIVGTKTQVVHGLLPE